MDLRQLKSIIKEFEDSTVHKLEITEKDFTVKLEKKGMIYLLQLPFKICHQKPLIKNNWKNKTPTF